jgi:hypothetical protein
MLVLSVPEELWKKVQPELESGRLLPDVWSVKDYLEVEGLAEDKQVEMLAMLITRKFRLENKKK